MDSADDAAMKIWGAGGTVLMEPSDVVDAGRVGVFSDPSGAVFCVWQADRHHGALVVNAPGAWNWSDLNTRDPDGAKAFYGAVFGWEASDVSFREINATMWRRPGYADVLELIDPDIRRRHADGGVPDGLTDAIGWLLPMTSDRFPSDVAPHWAVSFAVDDTDAIAGRAAELGGTIVAAPFDAGLTRLAVLADPQGAAFSISTYTSRG